MLGDELIQLAAIRIQIELAERRERFGQEIQRMISEVTLPGLGRSGAVVERIVRAIAREFDIRAMLAWQVLSRVMSGEPLPFDPRLSRQVKRQIERHLDAECEDLARQYPWAPNAISIAGSLPSSNDIRAKAVAKIGVRGQHFAAHGKPTACPCQHINNGEYLPALWDCPNWTRFSGKFYAGVWRHSAVAARRRPRRHGANHRRDARTVGH
jgi:hypothetical protein